MSTDWHSGTPSIGEWNGAWRAIDTEGQVTHEEWLATWESLDRWLSRIGKNGFDADCDFFLRSTWFDDHRSQVVELVNPRALTFEFLCQLQQWIRESFPTWRVIVPVFLGEANVIVVYRDAIREGTEFESDWPAGLECARRGMLELDQFRHIRD
jgi:hypothetical protein